MQLKLHPAMLYAGKFGSNSILSYFWKSKLEIILHAYNTFDCLACIFQIESYASREDTDSPAFHAA